MKLSAARSEWLGRAYLRYGERVFSTCMRYAAGNRAWAWDRMQETFEKLGHNIDTVIAVDDPGGWLYRVAINTCIDDLRQSRLRRFLLDAVSHGVPQRAPSIEAASVAKAELSEFELALGALPAKQRLVIVLVHIEQRSQTEVAEALSLSKGQISKLHARAVTSLREMGWDVHA